MSTWANRTKQQTSEVPTGTKAIERGERFIGVIDSAEPTAYSTGSFGVKLKYVVEGLERAVYENIVLNVMSKEGTLSPTKYGESTLKRRYAAAGASSDEINSLKTPRSPKDEGSLGILKGAKVAVYLVNEEYLGKPTKRVKSVWPLDGNK